MGQTPPPAMDEALGQADQVPNVKTTPKEGLLHALFAIHQGGPIDKMIDEGHQRRLAEARMHKQNMNTIAAKIHYDEKMRRENPPGEATVMEGGVTPGAAPAYTPLSNAELQDLRRKYDAAEQLFNKAAGIDKPTKAHAGAISTVLRHIVHRGAGQPKQQGGPTPPPTDGGGTPQQGAPLGSSSKPTPPPSGPSDAAMLPFERADIIRQQDLQDYTNREKVLYDLKMQEDAAKAKAQAEAKKATTGSARPAVIAGISARKAKFLAASGKKYKDLDDNEINVAELPDSMGLKSFTVKMPDGHWEMRYEPFSPNQKQLTAGNQTWTINPMDVEGLATDEGTYLGEHVVPSTTATKDPISGLTTTATRTPTSPGIPGRTASAGGGPPRTPQGTAPDATGAVPQARKPSPPPTGPQGGAKAAPKPSAAKGADTTLDPDGKHVSTNAVGQKWHAGVLTTPIIEAANQLIDDRDVDKIPPKVRELAAALAREKTGWWQGKFNPREENQMDEAKTFLEALRDDIDPVTGKPDKALSVLDSGAWHRFWVGKGMESHKEGQGILGAPAADIENLVRSWRATSRSPSEAAFARKFQQASNVISGLAQLTRGGTRPTDKSVETIRQELPNIFQATNRKDAIARINNLLKEVDIARRTGTERRGGRGPTPPPTTGGTGRVLVEGKDF